MASPANLSLDKLKDIRDRAQALVSDQKSQLQNAHFLEGTSLAVAELNDDETLVDPAIIDALKHDCDSLEDQIKQVQEKLAKRRQIPTELPAAPPKHLRKLQVLEAKRRVYAAELSELQKREPTYVPEVQSNPDYIKNMARQEAEETIAQLEQTIETETAKLAEEKEGLERDEVMLKELESISRSLEIKLRVLDKRGGKLKQLKATNHKKELERRRAIVQQDTGRVTSNLVQFLDKHFTMTEQDYKTLTALAEAANKPAKPRSTDEDEDANSSGGEEEAEKTGKRSRKRRRNSEERPEPNADYSQDDSATDRKPILNMKHMLQELLNKAVTTNQYVNWATANWFEYYVEFLVDAGVVERHPNDAMLIRLVDFL